MIADIRLFWRDETGATTVDWVVLAGGCMALAVIMLTTMDGSVSSVADEIETVLTDVDVVEIGAAGGAEPQVEPSGPSDG